MAGSKSYLFVLWACVLTAIISALVPIVWADGPLWLLLIPLCSSISSAVLLIMVIQKQPQTGVHEDDHTNKDGPGRKGILATYSGPALTFLGSVVVIANLRSELPIQDTWKSVVSGFSLAIVGLTLIFLHRSPRV